MTGEVPANRFDAHALHSADPVPGKLLGCRAGFIEHIDQFDAEFFGLSAEEAAHLDPQQRLLMMTAWEALEDAGLPAKRIAGTRAGVYVAHMHVDYAERPYRRGLDALVPSDVKNYRSLLSGRLSYTFDLRGPSISIDTACSGSLVGAHLACQSLRAGETTLALVCGVNLKLLPDEDVLISQVRMMAPDGRCKFGDASADGFCPSDGVGVIVLKPLAQALADGNRVRAVILGSAVSNDGASSGKLMYASLEGQIQTLQWAYQDAGVSPADVDFVEAHGTGTPVIDPLELTAFGEVLGEGRSPDAPLLVGSVKTNIGHSEGASGLAAVIKAVLSLEHHQIPPSLHFQIPNPNVAWDRLPVAIPTTMQSIPNRGRLALAGVSGEGFSAVNAHVVIQEADPAWNATTSPDIRPRLFVMSARTSKALHDLTHRYLAYLEPPGKGAAFHLRDICHSAIHRRQHHSYRFAAVVQDHNALINALYNFLEEESTSQIDVDPNITEDGLREALVTLATRYVAGKELTDWGSASEEDARFVPLPTYPWQTASYWLEA
jgi:acyl transferase domain-containing protein